MAMTKTCEQCGEEYKTRKNRSKYCSRECAGLAKKANRVTLTCQQCGEMFELAKSNAKARKYCSQACYTQAQLVPREELTCHTCGNIFVRRKGESKGYCSRKCWSARTGTGLRVIATCQECKKPFDVLNHKQRKHKYCSMACQAKANEKRHRECTCEVCGNGFNVHAFRKTARFCSQECSYIGRQGSGSPVWRGGSIGWYGTNWSTQRKKALERDHHQCQLCPSEKKTKSPLVHHLIALRLFKGDWKKANRLKNLITLCRSCHGKVESGSIIMKVG